MHQKTLAAGLRPDPLEELVDGVKWEGGTGRRRNGKKIQNHHARDLFFTSDASKMFCCRE